MGMEFVNKKERIDNKNRKNEIYFQFHHKRKNE